VLECSHNADSATPPASVISSLHHDLDPDALDRLRYSVEAGVTAGFQIASGAGPLCEEPLWGVAFEVYHVRLAEASTAPPSPLILLLCGENEREENEHQLYRTVAKEQQWSVFCRGSQSFCCMNRESMLSVCSLTAPRRDIFWPAICSRPYA